MLFFLEAATMAMARRAEVDAAPSKLVPCGTRKVLLVERFDIHSATMGRHHLISMQTLLRAEGYYNASYRDIADVIRRISANPGRDSSPSLTSAVPPCRQARRYRKIYAMWPSGIYCFAGHSASAMLPSKAIKHMLIFSTALLGRQPCG